jgi:DNA-binding MarR family transcriptional regulator
MAAPRNHDLAECTICACFAVRRAARAITQHYDRALRPSGLRATQFTLLTVLSVGGPLPLSRVAGRLGMERTTLTRNLKPLVDAGLVGVEHGGDRRVRTISITAKGYRAAVAALPHWRRAQRAVASQLTTDVFDSLADVTQRLSSTRTRTRGARQRQAKEMRK